MSRMFVGRDRRGIALVTVLLVALAVSTLAIAATMLIQTGTLIRKHSERGAVVDDAALAGLEEARSTLNGNPALYPQGGGYVTLESNVSVRDAAGDTIPGLRRSTYAGPSGIVSGQYGIFGSIISVTDDGRGNRRVRRMVVNQESFAKYAYFTTIEPSGIRFGNTDQIFGPVHSNDNIRMYAPSGGNQATFHDLVTTAGIVENPSYGNFIKGYTENVPPVPLPGTPALNLLRTQAQTGGLYFVGSNAGNYGEADLRIEFIPVDLDGNPATPTEGFIRVYRNAGAPRYVVAGADYDINRVYSAGRNCGSYVAGTFTAFNNMATTTQKNNAFDAGTVACFLGGDERLAPGGNFVANIDGGQWLQNPAPPAAGLCAQRPLDCQYLFPLTRNVNINSKGVIFVEGKVAVSGTVRGLTTLAATGDIIIADDIRQETDPSANLCDRDIVGLFSQNDVIVAHNTRNSPWRRPGSGTWRTLGATPDETIQAIILALDVFTVQNYDYGPAAGDPGRQNCELVDWGRGCLYLTGGIIQRQRGAVGQTNGNGSLKRYDYNACAGSRPPPYFPTTGRFVRNHTYDLDPVGFDVATWFADNQS